MNKLKQNIALIVLVISMVISIVVLLILDIGFQSDKEICLEEEWFFENINCPPKAIGDWDINDCTGDNPYMKCHKWRDKTKAEIYCDKTPQNTESCVCERYDARLVIMLETDWDVCNLEGNCPEPKICTKARPKTLEDLNCEELEEKWKPPRKFGTSVNLLYQMIKKDC